MIYQVSVEFASKSELVFPTKEDIHKVEEGTIYQLSLIIERSKLTFLTS